jgi:group II intron reverse transcriptase/maturase
MDKTVTKLDRITTKAKREPKTRFTYVKYLLNEEYLFHCFQELEKKKAAGVDGRTVESYTEEEIRRVIRETIDKMKRDQYEHQPIRRVFIPKENGKKRALGIPTVIDKIIQLGCGKIINAIWEPKFLPVSYGYRPGRDAHAALKEINHMLMGKPVNYVVEADIEGFFDHIDHKWMRRCLEEHIGDPRFLNLITQMLKAGVMEKGKVTKTTEGTPQGGIISPILANVYLHYVLDLWFERREQKKMKGYTQLVRYADDFMIGCQNKEEAEMILQNGKERLAQFGLKLSVEKTRIIEFGRFARENRERRKEKKPDTFDFLGFTHYCDKTRDGRFAVKVRTSRKRMKRSQQVMHTYIKNSRSIPVKQMWEMISMKLRGHYQYYGVSGNFHALQSFYRKTRQMTFIWLNKRSQKRSFNWEQFTSFMLRYPLPQPKLYYAFYNTW